MPVTSPQSPNSHKLKHIQLNETEKADPHILEAWDIKCTEL